MPETETLQRVRSAFQSYIGPEAQIDELRQNVYTHLNSLVQHLSRNESAHATAPTYLNGHHKKYIETAQALASARRRLEHLQRQKLDADSTDDTSVFPVHVDTLKLDTQYLRYKTLLYYAVKAEDSGQIASADQKTHRGDDNRYMRTLSPTASSQLSSELLYSAAKSLEQSVLRASYDFQQERRSLLSMQSRPDTREGPQVRKQNEALVAAKADLTDWIERSLAECDSVPVDEPMARYGNNDVDEVQERCDLTNAYKRYLEKRGRVIIAATKVTQLPTSNPQQPVSLPIRGRQSMYQPLIPALRAQNICNIEQIWVIRQYSELADEIILRADHLIHDQLTRLGDESHLLPAYPRMTYREYRRKIRSESSHDTDETSQSGRIEHLIDAWRFATQAAMTATSEGINSQCEHGKTALEDAGRTVESIYARMEGLSRIKQERAR